MIDFESQYLLFRHASPRETYEDGASLFDIGDAGEVMYVVKSGSVELSIGDTRIETVGPGEAFGEMALIDGSQRSATAVCIGETELIPISLDRFKFLVQAAPEFSIAVMKTMADRLRARTRHMASND